MRLLVILPVYKPAACFGGGVVSTMATLCEALAADGVEVTVYTTNASGESQPLDVPVNERTQRGGVDVFYFKSTFGPISKFHSYQLVDALKKTVCGFDAVYIAAWFMWLGIAAARICRRSGVPVIAGIHGGFIQTARQKSRLRKTLFWHLFIRRAIRGAAALHLTCPAEERRSRDWLEERPVMLVPGPVDPQKFQYDATARSVFRRTHGISASTPVIICAMRFDWMKRTDLLIQAIKRLPSWRLILAGDHLAGNGPEMQRLAQRLALDEQIIWAGFLHAQQLAAALSASDILALVSESENYGNVVVEAMMCGLPVLVSKGVGLHDLVEDRDFCFTTDLCVESVVEALSRFGRDRQRWRDEAASIRAYAVDRFSPEAMAKQFQAEWRRIVRLAQ